MLLREIEYRSNIYFIFIFQLPSIICILSASVVRCSFNVTSSGIFLILINKKKKLILIMNIIEKNIKNY